MPKKEKSCGVILFRTNKKTNSRFYLILHYAEHHWDYPKGHVEEGEIEEQTFRRELEEETGITEIKIIHGFREKIEYSFEHKNKQISKEVIFFLAETEEEKVRLSDEHTGFKWLKYEDALDQVTFKNAKNLLEKAEAFLNCSEKYSN
ncbi:NUDIX domain-containing protein [Candidatus Woesearchaeota archaeon]|nr:NUDIX domain-containing protein [Candidatus Woesearchaeota archaeon]